MTFVQIVDCKTDKEQELGRLMDRWLAVSQGKRTARHSIVARDRGDSHHYVEIVEFPSYEAAMKNSNLPETDKMFNEMVALCEEPPQFTNLDVVRDDGLYKETSLRFFEQIINGRKLEALPDILAENYVDHDPVNEQDIRGPQMMGREIQSYVDAFDMRFTINHQMAEGDAVATQWTCTGTHRGEFMGIAATGRDVTVDGSTVQKFGKDGKIVEAWWHWNALGLMRQIGALPS